MIDLKKVATTVGIAVLLAFFVYFTIDAIYPEPTYEQFCNSTGYGMPARPMKFVDGYGYVPANNCSAIPGIAKRMEECSQQGGYIEYKYDDLGCETEAVCNTCSKRFDEARKPYSMDVFYITAPIGVAAIVLGMYLPLTVEAIAAGVLFGGIATLFQSTVRVFGDLGKWARVVVLFIELCIMVWVALKKVSDYKPAKKRK